MATDDPFDDELRTRLHSATHAPGGERAPLDELRPRFGRARARRQRRIAAAISAPVAVALIVVGGFVLGGNDQPVDVREAPVGDRPPTTSTLPATSGAPSTTIDVPGPTPSPTEVPATIPPVIAGPRASTTAPPAPSHSPSGAAPTPTPTTPSLAPPPAGGAEVLTSDGGTATVTWSASSLTLTGTQPAPGWSVEQTEQKSPTRIVVRFRRDSGGAGSSTATIDARVTNGRLESST